MSVNILTGGNLFMKNYIVDLCTYHAKNGLILVNTTEKVLRVKELDSSIEYILSSVYPKDLDSIPERYIAKAEEYGIEISDLRAMCNSSLLIDVKLKMEEIRKCIFKETFICKNKQILDIITRIIKKYPTERLVIIGSAEAAKAFPSYIVEPVYLGDNIIRCDYFKSYLK